MNPGRLRRRTKMSSLLSSTIITTTIITASIADMAMRGMAPASWWCPDIVVIIIITITLTPASPAATIEVARRRMMKRQDLRVLFACAAKACSVWLNQNRTGFGSLSDAFSSREPVSTSLENALVLAGFLLRRAMKMPIGAVEHGVGRRGPLGSGRQRRPAGVDAPGLEFAPGRFPPAHLLEFKGGFLGDHDDLRERFIRPENVGAALGRRLKDRKEHNRQQVSHT